ncbi:MAG: hypothetical protein OXD45_09740, partial [Rhodobacteraceae bacterium]|nr:hypothetical protein [Paracoccaceae bacterium]
MKERSATPSSGRFRRRHAGRARPCRTRFAGHGVHRTGLGTDHHRPGAGRPARLCRDGRDR